MIVTDKKNTGDAIQLIAKRKDGSVRQVLVQNSNGDVLANGYFPAGTFMEVEGWLKNRRYHWIDAWSDEELLDPANNLTFTPKIINTLRQEAVLANMNREIVSDSLENYKRK